jgi:hypothetical protein
MRKKKPDKELSQLKNALRFLADELERTAGDQLMEGQRAQAASKAGLHLGISKARYQAAGAVHLVVNMVETLDSNNELGPLSIVREVMTATDQ